MDRPMYYKRNGEPYSGGEETLQWGKDFKNKKLKLVKQELLSNGFYVSTVWLGLDHSFHPGQKPLIFETMVFKKIKKDKLGEDVDMDRYSTEAEALQGHEEMVKKWSKV